MTRVLLIRHGQSTWNLEARYQGRLESPLSSLGRAQSAAVVRAVASVAAVYTSPLARCREMAAPLAAKHAVAATVRPDLIEVSHGPFDGLLVSEIVARYPREFAAWRDDPNTLALPDVEPFESARRRGLGALQAIAAAHRGATVAAVSHGGLLRAALVALLDAPARTYWRLHLDNGGITTVEVEGDHARIVTLNDIAHLRGLEGVTVEE